MNVFDNCQQVIPDGSAAFRLIQSLDIILTGAYTGAVELCLENGCCLCISEAGLLQSGGSLLVLFSLFS